MIRSMTGYGSACMALDMLVCRCDIKSVNGRFLKLSWRLPPSLDNREHELETLVRSKLGRGSVTLRVSVEDTKPEALVRVNEQTIRAYQEIFRRLGVSEEPLATLPGVLNPPSREVDDEVFAQISNVVGRACDALVAMRQEEGMALYDILSLQCNRIETHISTIRDRGPSVLLAARQKLSDRLEKLVSGFGQLPTDNELLEREIAILADRSDVTEEIDRVFAHLKHVRSLLMQNNEAGRTLEFLAQELLREFNTLGSKSSDADIGRLVILAKVELERFREQIANVE